MVDPNPTLEVQVTSTTTVFPSSIQKQATTSPLSISDNTVAKFARCAAIWYFDPPTSPSSAFTSAHLHASLSKTLNFYPHFSGRLSWATPSPTNKGHTSRYRRVHVTYNVPTDIGVPFILAVSPKRLSDFLPGVTTRRTAQQAWDSSTLPSKELIPPTLLALSRENLPENAPNMIIQFTTFSCESTALSISISHGLSDAQTLSNFANDWSSISRSMLSDTPLPIVEPVFSPHLLDEKAAGDIDAEYPDEELQKQARKLPMLRYDWYIPVLNQPWPDRKPADFPTDAELSPSIPIPWEQWNVTKPASSRILHFSAEEIEGIYERACMGLGDGAKISKHDALLAHLWSRINVARLHESGTETHVNISLGLRQRLSLPEKFVGSPILLAAISSTVTDSTSPNSDSGLALKISKTMKKFNAEAIGKVLHDEAFEVDPQRLWRGCLGKEHLMVTSWVYSGVQEVDFAGRENGGGRLRWVQPVMLPFDGLVVVMEGVGEGKGHWARNGVDVCLFLESGAMERLVNDKGVWLGR